MFDVTDATSATCSELNEVYRGKVYGEEPIFSPEMFDMHIRSNDIDLRHSVSLRDKGGGIAALALIGFRGRRAWIGGFGVSPRFRRRGLGKTCLDEALRSIEQVRCDVVELEVLETNDAARHLYESRGFVDVGKLFVWRSSARENNIGPCRDFAFIESSVLNGIAKHAPCWQREDASIGRQPPPTGVERFRTSWAIIRQEATVTRIVDVAAGDDEVTQLFDQLEKFRPLVLVNESATSNVSMELVRRCWPTPTMQYRMICHLPFAVSASMFKRAGDHRDESVASRERNAQGRLIDHPSLRSRRSA